MPKESPSQALIKFLTCTIPDIQYYCLKQQVLSLVEYLAMSGDISGGGMGMGKMLLNIPQCTGQTPHPPGLQQIPGPKCQCGQG